MFGSVGPVSCPGLLRRRSRRGIGRTEVLVGVAVVAILGLLAVPLVGGMGRKSAREEVPLIVEEIRKFEKEYQGPFGEYVSADPAPRQPHEVDQNAVPWASNSGYDKIGFSPVDALGVEELYGSYKVAATATGFTVTGTADVDGDGARAEYVGTESEPAKATTDASVY